MKKAYAKLASLIVFFLAFIGILVNSGLCAPDKLSIEEIIQKVAPSVVTIEVFDRAGDLVSEGTGYVVGPNLVLTNSHIVDDAFSLKISHPELKKLIDPRPRILKFDPVVDLALLEAHGIDSPPLIMEFDGEVKAGQTVVVFGNLWAGERLVSEGIVRACRPKTIVFSAPIHSGHSGSPLLDMQGRVIGICFSSMPSDQGENMAFAVNLPNIEKFMNSADKPKILPLAGTSLFWPHLFKRIWSFASGLFSQIFNAGEWLFLLFLKIASVIVLGIFIYWAVRLTSVKAYIVFAISVITLISFVFLAFFAIVYLLENGFWLKDITEAVIILTLLGSSFLFSKRYYHRHRPGKVARPKANASEPLVPNEVGIAIK